MKNIYRILLININVEEKIKIKFAIKISKRTNCIKKKKLNFIRLTNKEYKLFIIKFLNKIKNKIIINKMKSEKTIDDYR